MWNSTIDRKGFSNGQFWVAVKYTDGSNEFEEIYNLSSQENLNTTVRNRIALLEETATFAGTVAGGAFTPPPKVVPTATPYDLAVQEVSRLKNLIELGVLKDTDQEFVDAVGILKAEYAKL